jgi:hypothetical protein
LFPSPFGQVELSLTGNYSSFRTGIVSGYSAPGAHQRNSCYADPQTAFNELFKSVTSRGAVELDPVHAQGGPNATTPEKQAAFTKILIGALAAGLTHVVTHTIDELSTPIRGLPGNESDQISIHEVGHGGGYRGVSADRIREKIRIRHLWSRFPAWSPA